MQNYPIDSSLTDCRNCSNHKPPILPDEGCIYCNPLGAHVLCDKAEDCTSFAPFSDAPKKQLPLELEVVDVAKFIEGVDFGEEEVKEEEKPKEEIKATPSPELEQELSGVTVKLIVDMIRGLEEHMKSIDASIDEIKKKMPATRKWRIVTYLSKKKSAIVAWKNRWKWKLREKKKSLKSKFKKKKDSLAALFPSKEEPKKEEEKSAEEKKETSDAPTS